MMTAKRFVVVFIFLVANYVHASPVNCKDLSDASNARLADCQGSKREQLDQQLNAVYQKLLSIVPDKGPNVRQKLMKAEATWLRYRKEICEISGDEYYGGAVESVTEGYCLTSYTESQIQSLKGLITLYSQH